LNGDLQDRRKLFKKRNICDLVLLDLVYELARDMPTGAQDLLVQEIGKVNPFQQGEE